MKTNLYKDANKNITVPPELIQATLQKMYAEDADITGKQPVQHTFLRKKLLWATAALVPCACLIILLLSSVLSKDSIHINPVEKQMNQMNLPMNLGSVNSTYIEEEDYISQMHLNSLLTSITSCYPSLVTKKYTAYQTKDGSITGDELMRVYENGDQRITICASTINYLKDDTSYKESTINGQAVQLLQKDEGQYMALYKLDSLYISLIFEGCKEEAFLDVIEQLL